MSKVVSLMRDSLVSFVNSLGVQGKDKAASTGYVTTEYTEAELLEMYRSSWLAKKIIRIPAFDSFRRWRAWQASKEDITLIEAEERRLKVKHKMLEARVASRLYGGAAIYIATGVADPMQPLDPASIGKEGIKTLSILHRRELTAGDLVVDQEDPLFGSPGWYELRTNNPTNGTASGGVRIHPTRLIVFPGEAIPDGEGTASLHRGWGDSVLTSVINAVKQADGTAANIASLIFEAKIDVFQIEGLMDRVGDPAFREVLLQRLHLANIAKGTANALVMDAAEKFDQKQLNFATLPEVLMTFMQLVSGAADIPATRLLGQAPLGMNATGESDLRNYYDRLQGEQEMDIRPQLEHFDECLLYSATGTRDEDTHYVWSSLWQMTDKERAEIGKINAETLNVLDGTALFPKEALANAGANLLVENSILPGLLEAIDDAGGLPDFEAEAEEERALAEQQINAANQNNKTKMAANDAAPRSLYISRKVINAGDIIQWARQQGFETLTPPDEMHVTIMYSETPVDWMQMGSSDWMIGDKEGYLTIRPGGPRMVDQFGEATVLLFSNGDIQWRHVELERKGAKHSHPEYQPHITLTWAKPPEMDLSTVKPYQGEIVLGPELFEEIQTDWASDITEV